MHPHLEPPVAIDFFAVPVTPQAARCDQGQQQALITLLHPPVDLATRQRQLPAPRASTGIERQRQRAVDHLAMHLGFFVEPQHQRSRLDLYARQDPWLGLGKLADHHPHEHAEQRRGAEKLGPEF